MTVASVGFAAGATAMTGVALGPVSSASAVRPPPRPAAAGGCAACRASNAAWTACAAAWAAAAWFGVAGAPAAAGC